MWITNNIRKYNFIIWLILKVSFERIELSWCTQQKSSLQSLIYRSLIDLDYSYIIVHSVQDTVDENRRLRVSFTFWSVFGREPFGSPSAPLRPVLKSHLSFVREWFIQLPSLRLFFRTWNILTQGFRYNKIKTNLKFMLHCAL